MRLDQLGPGERALLRCASIVGTDVERRAVSALLPDRARPFIERHLDTLARKAIDRAHRHGHIPVSSCVGPARAYHSMTHEDPAQLHELFARWLAP